MDSNWASGMVERSLENCLSVSIYYLSINYNEPRMNWAAWRTAGMALKDWRASVALFGAFCELNKWYLRVSLGLHFGAKTTKLV